MKLIIVILTVFLVQVSASTNAQQLTLKDDHILLKEVFQQIRKQTGYTVLAKSNLINKAKPISLDLHKVPLEEALKKILDGQNLDYTIKNKAIFISEKEEPSFLDRVVDAFTPPINISGLVLDEKGQPLAGVTVRVKGTNKATFTDNSGKFYLAGVDDDAVIELRMVGYKVLELSAKGKFEAIKMEVLSKDLEEVVVAYGKTTQQALTGAVTVVKGEQIADLPYTSFDKALQGLVPGLQITQGTGQPGGGVANMVLRGISTAVDVSDGATTRNPLIVIDGVPVSQDGFQYQPELNLTPVTNPLAQLNPADIETISVLKDAAAIALYGSRASNGVILVTTKTGKTGKITFGFSHQTDLATRPDSKVELLNREEYLGLLYETYKNTPRVVGGVSVPWTDADILADLKSQFPVRSDGSFYPAPDWEKELFTRNASTISNNLNMSGGNDKSNFYLNFEYTKENGSVSKTGFERKSMRFNFESRPASWLKLGTNTSLSYNSQQIGGATAERALSIAPLYPIYLEDGNYMYFYPNAFAINPVAAIAYNTDKNTAYRGLSKLYAEVNVLPNLSFKSDLGVDFMLAELKQKNDPRFYESALPFIKERDERRGSMVNSNFLNFGQSFKGGHSINILLGQEVQIITQKQLGAEVIGTAKTLPYYEQLTNPGYNMNRITGNNTRQTLLAFFGQASYGYADRYFLSGSVRKDGSSKFGNQSQWGTYWSTGAGWVVSEEAFLKKYTATWLNYLKLRGSIGAAGNSGAVDKLARFDLINTTTFGGNPAISHESLGNPGIQWEETFTWDAGLEVRLFKDRLSLTVDIYNKKTKGLIYTKNLSSLSGLNTVQDNIGDMKNKGLELSLSGTILHNKDFSWNLSGNWSSNKNILVKAYVPLIALNDGILGNEEGRNFNSFYMPVWMGVNPADGKPQWLDQSGKPTSSYFSAKKEFVGKPQPDGFGTVTNSFSYNNFGLSVGLYYQYGVKIYNSARGNYLSNDGNAPYLNQIKGALDYWKKPGDIAINPRRLLNNFDDLGTFASTRFLERGDYIRLQNVNLNYSFPKAMLSRIGLTAARIFLQGHNLAVFTLYSGADPDNASVGGDTNFAYPIQRSFSAGLNVNF